MSVSVTPESVATAAASVPSSMASLPSTPTPSVASSHASTVESTPSSAQSIASSELSTPSSAQSAASSEASVQAVQGPPDKYQWVVAPGVKVDDAVIERTAATARELGLTNEAGQRLFDAEVARVAAERTDNAVGGTAWQARVDQWSQEAIADKEIGGSPEKYAASVALAKQALQKYGSPEIQSFLDHTGFGAKKESPFTVGTGCGKSPY